MRRLFPASIRNTVDSFGPRGVVANAGQNADYRITDHSPTVLVVQCPRAERRDGTTFPVEVTCAHFQCQAQRFTVVHFCDVSARHATETRLRQLSSALEQIADHAVITDGAGTILYVNRTFEEVTGYSRNAAIGKTMSLVKSGKHDAAFYADLWATLRSGSIFRGELVNRNARGDLYIDEQRISPFTDEATGETYYIATGRDVTERHFRDALTGLPTRAALIDLHYQPIVSLATGSITSCEALVRWNHPTRGFVPPLDFIGIAEESGLIVPLGQLVLEKACRQARSWEALGRGDLSVAVILARRDRDMIPKELRFSLRNDKQTPIRHQARPCLLRFSVVSFGQLVARGRCPRPTPVEMARY